MSNIRKCPCGITIADEFAYCSDVCAKWFGAGVARTTVAPKVELVSEPVAEPTKPEPIAEPLSDGATVAYTALHCDSPGHDKIYLVSVKKSGSGFIVHAEWGPRIGWRKDQVKTPSPVSVDRAMAVARDLVTSKRTGKSHYHDWFDAPKPKLVDPKTASAPSPKPASPAPMHTATPVTAPAASIPSVAPRALDGKSVLFTGAAQPMNPLTGNRYTRKDLDDLARANGAVVAVDVTRSLSFLVQADPNSTSSKSEKAKRLGVPCITAEQFLAMCDTSKATVRATTNADLVPMQPEEEDDAAQVEEMLDSDEWIMQEKMDGKHVVLCKSSIGMTTVNKLGRPTTLAPTPRASLDAIKRGFETDGEEIGDAYYIYDFMSDGPHALRDKTTDERIKAMNEFGINFDKNSGVHIVPSYSGKAKRELFERWKKEGKEGAIFKRRSATYIPGKTFEIRKVKFWKTATVKVAGHNDKRSVQISVYDGVKLVGVGNVTISPNKDVPAVGALIEIRYLYAFRGGSVFQPTFLKERDDVVEADASIKQLKYKGEPTV